MPVAIVIGAILRPAWSARARPRALRLIALATLLALPAFAQSPLEGCFQGPGESKLGLQVYALSTDDPADEHLVIAETTISGRASS